MLRSECEFWRVARITMEPVIGVVSGRLSTPAPSISAVRDSPNQPYFPSSQVNNGSGDFTLPVDMPWEIDLWGRIRRSVTAAREQAQASAADMAAMQMSLQAELAFDDPSLSNVEGRFETLSTQAVTIRRNPLSPLNGLSPHY